MSSSQSNTNGGFPLRVNFFRSLPLNRETNDALYVLAKRNAIACLNQSFNDQWRYVPPEKDGTQIRKDTSNLAASYRLVRAATVLRCQEHEVNQVISNTNTESWREFMRKCFGKYYVDTIILHTVTIPPGSSSSALSSCASTEDFTNSSHRSARLESEPHDAVKNHDEKGYDDSDNNQAHSNGRQSYWQKGGANSSEQDASTASSRTTASFLGSATPSQQQRRSSETVSFTATNNQDDHECDDNDSVNGKSMHCAQADEFVTAKWGVFDSGLTGKRDMCLVDYLSLAYIPNTDKKEQVHLWCFTSTEGDAVGCMELKDTHNVARTTLTKLGVFWRKLSEEETEVIICGSFPSKHSQAVSSILLTSLNRLQGIVEDLRLSSQVYIHRSTWVKDNERTSCHLCMRNFHALRRKHHCRKCGEVICSDCSNIETIDLPVLGYTKLRLCKVCGIRARSMPLKRVDKSNVFDRLVRARSLSNINAAGSPFARSSYAESKHLEDSMSMIEDSMVMNTPTVGEGSHNHQQQHHHHHHHAPKGLDAHTHSSSSYSSNSNNNDADQEDSTNEFASAAAIHPISRTTHPDDFDDFIDGRSPKTQPADMEKHTTQQHTAAAAATNSDSSSSTHSRDSNMFDLLCELACQTLNCPIASVCIVDGDGDFVRSAAGLHGNAALDDELSTFIEKVMGSTAAIVLDANVDKQTQQVFAKRGNGTPPAIRFFAGCPIYSRLGKKLGYVCVADVTKRDTIGASCAFTMERLATLAVTTMERNISANAKKQQQEREIAKQLQQEHEIAKQLQQEHEIAKQLQHEIAKQLQQEREIANQQQKQQPQTNSSSSHPTALFDRQNSASGSRAEPPAGHNAALVGRVYEVFDETPATPMHAASTTLPVSPSSSSSATGSSTPPPPPPPPPAPAHSADVRYGEFSPGYYEAQDRIRKLLLKSYHTQQQLASGSSPTMPSTMPSSQC
ncbi:Run and fyve domain-containing protein 1, partial [Globisporangium splendens]